MSSNGHGAEVQAIPLLAFVPLGILRPQFHLAAQWHTGTGILCVPQPCPLKPLEPADIANLFVSLIKQGHVRQRVRTSAEDAAEEVWEVQDLPVMHFVVGPAPAPTPPPSQIIVP